MKIRRRKKAHLYFLYGVHREGQPYPQQQTYQTREVEERQHGPGCEHGSPGRQPLLFEGRVVGPLGEGPVPICVHHRGLPHHSNMNLSGFKKKNTTKKPKQQRFSSAFDCCSLFQPCHTLLSFRVPRGFPSRPYRVGEMIAACYLLTINCRCLFSFPSHGDQVLLFSMPKEKYFSANTPKQCRIFFVCHLFASRQQGIHHPTASIYVVLKCFLKGCSNKWDFLVGK